ncbi:YmL15 [Geranomyces michiganensis]|nr:YmL15 [Geranomyces michiganensis]
MVLSICQRLSLCSIRAPALRHAPLISVLQPIRSTAAPFHSVVRKPTEFVHSGNVKDNNGARRKRKVVGRGEGGKGKTSGRGQKGYNQRQNRTGPTPGFEGGQTGLIKAIPHIGRRGFTKPRFARLYLDTLQHYVETGKLDASKTITIKELVEAKAVGKIKDGVVLLGKGGEFFKSKVNIEVTRATQPAIKLVEEQGGTVQAVYHGKDALKAILRPDRWAIQPKNPMPTRAADIARYTDSLRRGYLADEAAAMDKRQLVKELLNKSRASAAQPAAAA